MCIMPWAASGASQEKALSIRRGVPSASTSRSSGPCGKPSGGPGSGVFAAAPVAGLPPGCDRRRRGPREGRLVAEAAGRIDAPSSICSRCIARQVWKPLEWAEMPRMACMRPAGRSSCRAAGRPNRSRAARSRSAARRRRAPARRRCAGWSRPACRSRSATASGAYCGIEIALGHQLEDRPRLRPSASVNSPASAGATSAASALRRRLRASGSKHSGWPCGVAREQPVVGGARRHGSPARARWCSAPG